jgi:hypothetical protein
MAWKRNDALSDDIYNYICVYADDHDGPTPSIREVSKNFGMCYSAAYHHIMKLIIDDRLMQRDGKLVVVGSDWLSPDYQNR